VINGNGYDNELEHLEWHQEMKAQFLEIFGVKNDNRQHEVLGISQENRPEQSQGDNRKAIQGQQSATVLPR
jgi:hypothetical protein